MTGKYRIKQNSWGKERALVDIANELAEANRLKRLEILIDVESPAVIDADSLEDQVD